MTCMLDPPPSVWVQRDSWCGLFALTARTVAPCPVLSTLFFRVVPSVDNLRRLANPFALSVQSIPHRHRSIDSGTRLDSTGKPTKNVDMEIHGRVQNGVVVLEGGRSLPERAIVTVSYPLATTTKPPDSREKVQLPLVLSDRPGNLDLTAERIAELWEEDDVSTYGGLDEAGP